ncbi:MAG: PQQ-binding-like beta-propeller repeat protein, partial [Planctomycetota bacterium]
WTSPVAVPSKAESVVLLQSLRSLVAVNAKTGKQVWEYKARGGGIPSASVRGSRVFLPSAGLKALEISSKPEAPSEVWEARRLRSGTASPLLSGDKVYTLADPILKCGYAESGDIVWQLRLEGKFSATPVPSGKHLYAFNEKGLGLVIETGSEGKIVSRCDMKEPILASPAVSDGALFVRSDGKLWKISGS